MGEGGANAAHLVGGNGGAGARAADQDASLRLSLDDRPSDGAARSPGSRPRPRTTPRPGPAPRGRPSRSDAGQALLQLEPAVVGARQRPSSSHQLLRPLGDVLRREAELLEQHLAGRRRAEVVDS